MRKIFIYFFMFVSIFACVPALMAWTDSVEGVLMPEPRGGGGISDEEVENALIGPEEKGSEDSQALIEWE